MTMQNIDSVIKTLEYENGEIQRVHVITLEKGSVFGFFKPKTSEKAFGRLCDLYAGFTVPKCPWIFGRLMHFCLPDDIAVPAAVSELAERYAYKYGYVSDITAKVTIAFTKCLRIMKDGTVKPRKNNAEGKKIYEFYRKLSEKGCAKTVCGKLPFMKILPVGTDFGLLSETENKMTVRANSTFFIMEAFDVTSVCDTIGTPFGLTVEDGQIITPPLYKREAFIVRKDGKISIERPTLDGLTILIGGERFANEKNGTRIFERPERAKSPVMPKDNRFIDLAVIGRRIVAVKRGGGLTIPAAGFVLRIRTSAFKDITEDICTALSGYEVSYEGMDDVAFAVSAGNSAIINGKKTEGFISPFYNIRRPWRIKYPPTCYPLNYTYARAPRMAVGATKDGRLVLLWAEGPGKFSYEKGKDSCGASLKEMADICEKLGIYNAVNLDGGGSSQILFNGERKLMISDRNKENNTEAERAVPLGLGI